MDNRPSDADALHETIHFLRFLFQNRFGESFYHYTTYRGIGCGKVDLRKSASGQSVCDRIVLLEGKTNTDVLEIVSPSVERLFGSRSDFAEQLTSSDSDDIHAFRAGLDPSRSNKVQNRGRVFADFLVPFLEDLVKELFALKDSILAGEVSKTHSVFDGRALLTALVIIRP
jgi:hypothetical protein